jgi:predicted HNH restriction endonuclease
LQQPIRVPLSLTSRFGAYFTRPTELDKREWDQLIAFSAEFADRARQDDYSDGGDTEFPEGKKYEVRHKRRERNPKLVAKAKAQFKVRFGRLFCEACDFDFAAKYGNAGDGFIEVHHDKIPVSELKPNAKTKVSDLALVCSNCHRILHRRRPWLTVQALRRLIKQVELAAAQ